MNSPAAVPLDLAFRLDASFPHPVLRPACDVRIYAPSWTSEFTASMGPAVRAAKEFVLAAARCGLSAEEIAEDVHASWPCLGQVRVTAEADGASLVIDID